ncbi:MAG: DUF4342 domain-containing protein [Patescibacteria group bacterium]|nr:DUF4342 domain-containing protein [Patescibacteria group bacterium]
MRRQETGAGSDFVDKVKKLAHDAVAWRLAVRQKFGKAMFTVPLIVLIPVTIIFPHFVLVAVLIALVAGYRMSFEKRQI